MSHSAAHATSSLPAPRRRITAVARSSKDMDLEAIRERRSRLEALTASLRLPPLLPSTAERRESTSSASVLKQVKPRRRHMAERPPTSNRDPTPSRKQMALESKLPALSLPPMTPYHNPLPDIGRTAVWEKEEEDTEEETNKRDKEERESPLHNVDSPPPPTYEETQQVSRWVEEINAQNLILSKQGESDRAETSKQSAPSSGKRRTPTQNPEDIDTQFTDLTSSDLEKRPATAASKGGENAQEDDRVRNNEVKVRIQELVEQLKSEDPSVNLEAMVESRKILSQEVDPPVQDFIDNGVLPLAIASIKGGNSDLQYEAAWVITNIASGTSEQTTAVVDHGAVPILIELLSSPEVRLQEQAAWALGNISADSPTLRNQLVADGMVKPLINSVNEDMPISFRRNLSWVLSNIFRYKELDMPKEEKLLVLKELKKNLQEQSDYEVKSNTIWTLNYFLEQCDSHIELVVTQGFVPLLVENINDSQLQKVTVRCLGNIVTGNDTQTDKALEAGILPLYVNILANSPSESIRKEVIWSVSNITAGTTAQIQRVVDAGLLPILVDSVMKGPFAEKKEACWALSNLTHAGLAEHVKAMVEADALPAFTKMLISTDVRLVEVLLEGLDNTLKKLSDSDEGAEEAIKIIREADGVDVLESLLKYERGSVVDRANRILTTYFPNSEEASSSYDAMMEDLRMIFGEPTEVSSAEAAQDLSEQASKYTAVPLDRLGDEEEEKPEGDGTSSSV
ncbi:importin subunit alpha-4-like isoform X2 [Penaeus monodon]|uniref:importin subunit alpha-4-like isoform X2 n=1 Tax=Penaeus monodon TaxID=6687 RepID=UPI0018A75EE3|nr:importin subunit alpha-4-like isoform X2 [Penaeus monodon]